MYRKGRILIIVGWLVVWQLLSMWVDNSILLVGPVETFRVLLGNAAEISFWKTIAGSLVRISAGFLAGWVLGLALAAVSAAWKMAEEIIRPVMTLMKTVPVASFVVLFLIWFRSDMLAVVISLCVVLPNVYLNTLEGIKSTDRKLLEMAKVYGMHPLDRFFYIYRPALKPFWDSCMKLSIGMSWKSGVAAEVIGTPDYSIGESLYVSKIYLDTAGVLAWTAVIILISSLCEKIFLGLWHRFSEWQPGCRGVHRGSGVLEGPGCGNVHGTGSVKEVQSGGQNGAKGDRQEVLVLEQVSKAYGQQVLFGDLTAAYEKGQIYYFTSPSGSGKTTLFRMICGLDKPDGGQILKRGEIAVTFQEDRLCESCSGLKNVELITGDPDRARAFLLPLLAEEDLHKPCSQLSGGMKRRVAVARAFAAEREIVLLDEPFAALDEENRQRMLEYIRKFGADKAVLVATHV